MKSQTVTRPGQLVQIDVHGSADSGKGRGLVGNPAVNHAHGIGVALNIKNNAPIRKLVADAEPIAKKMLAIVGGISFRVVGLRLILLCGTPACQREHGYNEDPL
jgi:hypothetical protein